MKRVLRVVGVALLVLLVLVAAVLGGGWLWLQSPAGGRAVREQLLSVAQDALAGRVEVGELRVSGQRLELRGLKLYTPEGALVAEVARVELALEVRALLGRDVVLREVSVEAPTLHLVQDERGLNLSRAIAAKHPSASVLPGGPPARGLHLELRSLRLTGGAIDFEAETQRLAITSLAASGHVQVRTAPLRVISALEVSGTTSAPLKAPLRLSLTTTSPTGDAVVATLLAALGDARLKGTLAWPSLELTGLEATAPPELLSALAPGWPVKVPLRVAGEVTTKRGTLEARAGAAVVTFSGAWDLAGPTVKDVELVGRDLNLAELLEGGKASRLSFTLKGSLTDARPESATGQLALTAGWENQQQVRLATVEANVESAQGHLTVNALVAKLPGLLLSAKGKASASDLSLTGRLEAKDLSLLGAVIAEFTGVTPPPFAGHGALDLTISGALAHPGVAGTGHFATLRGPSFAMEALDLDVKLPDVRRPWDADGVLAMRRLTVGGADFEAVTARLQTQGRAVEASVMMKGLGDLQVDVTGLLDRDVEGFALSALAVRSAEGEWSLEAPAHVDWTDGRLSVEPVTLRSGAQRLSFQGKKSGPSVEAAVRVEQLRLSSLPRVLAPASLGLGGLLSAQLEVDGRLPRPKARLHAVWRDGAVGGLDGLQLVADLDYVEARAKGTLQLTSPLGRAEASLDVPVVALLERRSEPLQLHLSAQDLDAQGLAALANRRLPVAGRLSLVADVGGLCSAPTVDARVEAPSLTVTLAALPKEAPLTVEAARLTLRSRDDGTLVASVAAAGLGGTASLELTTPLTLAGLRAAVPSAEEFRKLPLTLRADVHDVNLKELHRLGLSEDDELAGGVSLAAVLSGSLQAPRAEATLTVTQATVPPLRALAGTVRLQGDGEATTLVVDASLAGKPFVTGEARLGAPLAALLTRDRLGAKTVDVHARLASFDLRALQTGRDGQEPTRGLATASLDVTGTPDAPVLSLKGAVQELSFARLGLGSARLVVQTAGKAQAVQLALGGLGREDLKVNGTVGVDLSLPSLERGVSLSATPLDLRVESRELDLAFLSGVHRLLRVVGGRLTMSGAVVGTVASPALRGDLHWRNGRLSVQGYGDYRDIEVDLDATNDVFDLQRMRLRAGAGVAELKAKATRIPGDAFHLELEGMTDRFPIVNDDQLMAIASLRVTGSGEITDTLVDLHEVNLPQVEVELPDVKRKDLQDLQRPGDIIVLRVGEKAGRRSRLAAQEAGAVDERPGRTYRALITAPRNVWLRSSDLNVELGLSERFRFEYAQAPQLFGEATILRGKLNVIGREFEVLKGSQVRFAGPARQPYVNVSALYTNEREKQVTKVTVVVAGRGTDVVLKVSSDPALSESEIYTLLATGRRELRRGSGATVTTEQAVSALGSVAASALKGVLSKKLPIDVLNFEATDNFQGVSDLKMDVGKYLSDSLFLGFSYQPGARPERGESQYAGRLELQMSRSWSLEAWAGTAPAAGADFVWSRDY